MRWGKEQLLSLLFSHGEFCGVQDVAPGSVTLRSSTGEAAPRAELFEGTLRGEMCWGRALGARLEASRVYFLQVSPSWTYRRSFLVSSAPICSEGSGLELMNAQPQHRASPTLFSPTSHQCLRFLHSPSSAALEKQKSLLVPEFT